MSTMIKDSEKKPRKHGRWYKNFYTKIIIILFAIGILTYTSSSLYNSALIYKEKKLYSQPFTHEYGMVDDYSKNNFKKTKTQDSKISVGSFKITLPTGKMHTTTKYYQLQEHQQNIKIIQRQY